MEVKDQCYIQQQNCLTSCQCCGGFEKYRLQIEEAVIEIGQHFDIYLQ